MRWIKNWLLKRLMCTVTVEDVMSIVQDRVGRTSFLLLGKQQISRMEWRALAEEAKFVEKTHLWSILSNSIVEQAKMRMFEQSRNDNDMMFGKAMLYTVDLQRKLIARVLDYKE